MSIQWPAKLLQPNVSRILRLQQPDGGIPWFEEGHLDPWDHTESAMALSVVGEYQAARKAFSWLEMHQLDDGTWWESYRDSKPDKLERRETNFIAYVATGVWHHYLITQDKDWLTRQYDMVAAAINAVLRLQSSEGEIQWAFAADGSCMNDALITGCSSIYRSLLCAEHIADALGFDRSDWSSARYALGDALKHKPHRFDRTWAPKTRFSMDWFYPILAGIYTPEEAQQRLSERWHEFVEPGMGCRCVSDEPWVTVAESCELVMALIAANKRDDAKQLFNDISQWRDEQGVFNTGWQFRDKVYWPEEQPTWTCAAAVLAADALFGYSSASNLFTSQPNVQFLEATCEP